MKTITVFPDDDHVELLIEEVERRPILYDKHMKGYTDNIVKKKEWDEVAIALVGEEVWTSMSSDEKKEVGYQIRKRWLNLRNCFARELRIQRQEKPRARGKKRRKYCYFDQLMFLMPSIELRESTGSGNDNSDDNIPEYIDTSSPPHNNDTEFNEIMDATSINFTSPNADCDEDKLFVLSLVPILRRLNDYEKLDMKVKILNLFKNKYRSGTTVGSGSETYSPDFESTSHQDIKNIIKYSQDSDED